MISRTRSRRGEGVPACRTRTPPGGLGTMAVVRWPAWGVGDQGAYGSSGVAVNIALIAMMFSGGRFMRSH